MAEKIVKTKSSEITGRLYGSFDKNARRIEEAFGVKMYNRQSPDSGGDSIVLSGEPEAVTHAAEAVEYLRGVAEYNEEIGDQTVDYVIGMAADGRAGELEDLDDCVCVTTKGKPIKAKTVGQKKYVEAIRKNTVTIGVGPAGTGKTFLAVAMSVKALRDREVERIILTRPAVEAGKSSDFCRGTFRTRSTRICARCTTRSMRCSAPRATRATSSGRR